MTRHRVTILATLVASAALASSGCERAPMSPSTTSPRPAPRPADAPAAASEAETSSASATFSDEAIERAARRELDADPAVDRTEVDLTVSEGIAQLTGRVDDLLAKKRAERIVEAVRGVRAVSNRLYVDVIDKPASQLETAIESAYALDPAAESYDIDVHADEGRVVLSGTVDSWPEKELAIRIAEGVSGVREVVDEIEVQYEDERTDAEIAADARARLDWDVLVDDAKIGVAVEDGLVHLTGVVGSAAEKRQALGDAYVANATDVDADALLVDPFADRDQLRDRKYVPRPDAAIADAIEDAAVYDPRVHAFDIDASVSVGQVTLTGTVATKKAKLAAGRLAEDTVGVISVTNLIQVVPPEVLNEAELSEKVTGALSLNPITEADQIDVTTSGSEVTLTGTVDSHYEKAEASDVASGVVGVTDVENLLRVRGPLEPYVYEPGDAFYPLVDEWTIFIPKEPRLPDDQLEKAIERELFWEPYASSWQITVEVDDGVATLKGEVDSPAEAATAVANAFQAGAVDVDDELTVDPS